MCHDLSAEGVQGSQLMNLYRNALTGITLALAAAVAAHATNGLYLTGYGPEELGRGGANLAVSDRSLGLNSNPAGIAQLQGDHFTASLAVLAPTLEFENMVNRADGRQRAATSRCPPSPGCARGRRRRGPGGSDSSPRAEWERPSTTSTPSSAPRTRPTPRCDS